MLFNAKIQMNILFWFQFFLYIIAINLMLIISDSVLGPFWVSIVNSQGGN